MVIFHSFLYVYQGEKNRSKRQPVTYEVSYMRFLQSFGFVATDSESKA